MKTDMKQHWIRSAVGLFIAGVIMMVIFNNGMSNVLGALSLIPMVFLFWYLGRHL